jgi:bifunctional non-homologous end joining protein LigD
LPRFAGHTGSGIDTLTIMELYDRLQELRISKPSQDILDTVQFINREPIWVKPKLVAEIKFNEWTKDGIMRIPIFLRLREDELPQDCIIEKEKSLEEIGSLASSVMPASTTTAAKVEFSKLDKVFWPPTKENPSLTKKDLIDYYDSLSPDILPYLKDRPLCYAFQRELKDNHFSIEIGKADQGQNILQVRWYMQKLEKRKPLSLYAITKKLYYGLPILAA